MFVWSKNGVLLQISTEHRFTQTPDGSIYSEAGGRGYQFWRRYLGPFEEVVVVARVREGAESPASGALATGPGVRFLPIPDFQGPKGLITGYLPMRAAWRAGMDQRSAYLLRVPGIIGSVMARDLRTARLPFGVEVVGDPGAVFEAGAFDHPLRRLIRSRAVRSLRSECRHAVAASYVTRKTLQGLYPPGPDTCTTHYSSVELPDDAFIDAPRMRRQAEDGAGSPLTVVTVGTLSQRYKGIDVLLDAIARASRELRLVVVGDGTYRSELETQAAALGLADRVAFLGRLPAGGAVREVLDQADLFVLASRTEGLPRALIEAMARGLPCIGTEVGGIPELLPPDDLVPRDDATTLARTMDAVLSDRDRMSRMSARNLTAAREYHADVLQQRREKFYCELRSRTEARLARR
jgi:glycosyltransferase involved in cell wall biosynthesis